MKYIAFYLPQYHVIPENSKWWGKDFTEWVRMRNAVPVFKGHYQPRIPVKYYDLADAEVMAEQAHLAKEYGIQGFCYYHYWFNGKLLLEKPLEQMLGNKQVDIPFCMCWANEKWTKAWDGKSKEILIDQEYGGEEEWLLHLNYLSQFFDDERYIRIDGRNVLLIYRTESFAGFDDMIVFWNKKLKEKGLEELYIIEMLTGYQKKSLCKHSAGVVEFEPMYTIGTVNYFKRLVKKYRQKLISLVSSKPYRLIDYDKTWHKILSRNKDYGSKTFFPGAFTDWDNSPRFKDKGTIFRGATPEKFQRYLAEQSKKAGSGFLFINAWNEWAEGAYLEPDDRNGTGYLEAVREAGLLFKQKFNKVRS